MNEDLPYRQRLNLIRNGLADKTTGPKPPKKLKRVSDKKAAEMKAEKEKRTDKPVDEYFSYHMTHSKPVCMECGMEAYWLLEEQTDPQKKKAYELMWRASQAHILPKKKKHGFPSVAGVLENHLVLFPSWGGHLCGDHGFFDSNWYNATTMKIWPKVVEIFKTYLYPRLTEEEKKRLPDVFKNTLLD